MAPSLFLKDRETNRFWATAFLLARGAELLKSASHPSIQAIPPKIKPRSVTCAKSLFMTRCDFWRQKTRSSVIRFQNYRYRLEFKHNREREMVEQEGQHGHTSVSSTQYPSWTNHHRQQCTGWCFRSIRIPRIPQRVEKCCWKAPQQHQLLAVANFVLELMKMFFSSFWTF